MTILYTLSWVIGGKANAYATLDDLMPHLAETFGDDVDEWEHREGLYLPDWVAADN